MRSGIASVADLLVDTDVFVDHLRTGAGFEPGTHSISYSVITRAELFAGRGTDEKMVARLLAPFQELPVDREVAELGGRLRRDNELAMPDALIAATALSRRLSVLTRNRRHFERVPKLRLHPVD